MTLQEQYINAIENAVRYGHTSGIRMLSRLGYASKTKDNKYIPFCTEYALRSPEDYTPECIRIAHKRKEGQWYDAAD